MRAATWLAVALGLPKVGATETGHPLANIVKLLETVQKETQESMDIEEKTLGDFECAKKKTDKAMTAQKEEAEAALKAAQQELDMVLNGATLTDEAATLAAKIQELDKQIKATQDEIDAEKAKTDAAVEALNAGITGLANAIDKLSAAALIEMASTVHHLVAPKVMDALPAETKNAVSTVLESKKKTEAADEQTPEQYEKQAGAVKKFMSELMISYKKEIISTEQDWKKTDAALKAQKETLEQEKSATQKENAEGAKEAAAKAAKEKELTDTINLSTDLIKEANDEMKEKTDAYEKALKEYQTTMTDLEAQMEALNEALKVLTSEEARDKRDTLAAALIQTGVKVSSVSAESFHSQKFKTTSEMRSAFQIIITQIDEFVSSLEGQTGMIKKTIATCEQKSRESLENLRDTAVYYDEEKLKRDNAQELIDTKTEKVEDLTKKTEETMKNLKEFEDECDEEVGDLTELKGKQDDVKQLIEQAFEKLKGYPDANTKFKTVFTLFTTELGKAQREIEQLEGEIKATNERKATEQGRVGVPPSEEGLAKIGKCEDEIAVCAGKETVLCDLRTNIDDLCNGINSEEGKKTDSVANMGTASQSLDSLLGSFADAQPGCDTPMINGPAQMSANAKEIDELKQAKMVLSSYDTQGIGQGSNYTVEVASDSTDANWDAAATGMF